jgi:predicted AAA+ superfamily ATPase
MKQLSLFQLLAAGLETVIRNGNPWWRGEPIAELPPFRRWAFEPVYRRLTRGLAPAIVLRGPRQIGKTTLLTQVVDQLMQDGIDPRRLFRLQFDDLIDIKTLGMPIVEMVEWYAREVLGETLNKAASEGRAPYVFLDDGL